jgi:hypothetical protein
VLFFAFARLAAIWAGLAIKGLLKMQMPALPPAMSIVACEGANPNTRKRTVPVS